MPPALGPRDGKMECTFGSYGKEHRERQTGVRPKKQSGGGPEADKKALGWGAQGSEARWARRDQKSGWPIGSWGGSAVRHLVGKVVL